MVVPNLVANMGEITCNGFEELNNQELARGMVRDIGCDRAEDGFAWKTFNYVSEP